MSRKRLKFLQSLFSLQECRVGDSTILYISDKVMLRQFNKTEMT